MIKGDRAGYRADTKCLRGSKQPQPGARTESGEERASLTPARFPTQEFSEALREEVVGRYKSWVFVSGKELQVAVDSKSPRSHIPSSSKMKEFDTEPKKG